jgi:glycosyltransferase involved in cell wall biosynthesis
VSVVLATYQRPEVLELVFRGLADQRDDQFEVIVADDGSSDAVASVVERWRPRLQVGHVWQPDEGFRKARILNRAALTASGNYLVFFDADCVPRRGLVSVVKRAARSGWFLSTKRVMLGERFSRQVMEKGFPIWRWGLLEWFIRAPREIRRPGYVVSLRDRRRPGRGVRSEFVPPSHAYSLIGVSREDFERVNGYEGQCLRIDDGEDQDLALRLRRIGLRCGWPGPAATLLHLWHPPGSYAASSRVTVFRETEADGRSEAVFGLRELASERIT